MREHTSTLENMHIENRDLASLGYKLKEQPLGWSTGIQILIWNILDHQR